jgi:carbonic anhydrase
MTTNLIHGHKGFRERYFDERELLQRLATDGQRPGALYIGCSDSRVVPEFLTGAGLGELFVVRNIANFVPARSHTDVSVGAAIEYAVKHLEVRDVIVCGHYGCGGVKAVITGLEKLDEDQELASWLSGMQKPVIDAKASGLTGDPLWKRAVEENVLASLQHLTTFDVVSERLDAGTLFLHGWVYDMFKGQVLAFEPYRDAWVDLLELAPKK